MHKESLWGEMGDGWGRTAGHHEDQRMLAQNLTLGDLFGFIFRRFCDSWRQLDGAIVGAWLTCYCTTLTWLILVTLNAQWVKFKGKLVDTLSLRPIIFLVAALFPLICFSTQRSFFCAAACHDVSCVEYWETKIIEWEVFIWMRSISLYPFSFVT